MIGQTPDMIATLAIIASPLLYGLGLHARRWMAGLVAGFTVVSGLGFAESAWPFGLAEAIWAGVALRRWQVLARVPRR